MLVNHRLRVHRKQVGHSSAGLVVALVAEELVNVGQAAPESLFLGRDGHFLVLVNLLLWRLHYIFLLILRE